MPPCSDPRVGLYIYFIYGIYTCFNVVTRSKGMGEAVLIRALEPLHGMDLMEQRRNIRDVQNLCNGPAKLMLALGIQRDQKRCRSAQGFIALARTAKLSGLEFSKSSRHQIGSARRNLRCQGLAAAVLC